MTVTKKRFAAPKPTLRVGNPVFFRLGQRKVAGRVVEDRGPIGIGGRRLYSVEFRFGQDEPAVVELPADEIEKSPA